MAEIRTQPISDRDAFERFLEEERSGPRILGVEYRGEIHSPEHIFYKWLRCELVHRASLPMDIRFIDRDKPDSRSIRAGGAPEYVLELGHGWFSYLRDIVMCARENADEFGTTAR